MFACESAFCKLQKMIPPQKMKTVGIFYRKKENHFAGKELSFSAENHSHHGCMHNGPVGVCLEIEDFDLVFCRKLESRTLFSTVLVSFVWRIGTIFHVEMCLYHFCKTGENGYLSWV